MVPHQTLLSYCVGLHATTRSFERTLEGNLYENIEAHAKSEAAEGMLDTIPGQRLRGYIQTYHTEEGFGFLTSPARSKEFFWHFTNADEVLQKRLREETETIGSINGVPRLTDRLFSDAPARPPAATANAVPKKS